MQIVDTNIFIRFLTNDDPKKAEACRKLLKKAEQGKVELQTTESIISETVFVLESKRLYGLSRTEIYDRLLPILTIDGLKVSYKNSIIRALEIYAKEKIHFEDAILVAQAERLRVKEIFSYDKGFDKIKNVKRIEP
jgi:predicted nucleic acid-binding protein